MKATEFLRKGADLLEERGKQYDQPGGERSMGKTVRAFNTITGRDLSEAEGWLLLQVLKDVRQWQNPEKYHADSAEDCVSYAALKAEALASLSNYFACGGKAASIDDCFDYDSAEKKGFIDQTIGLCFSDNSKSNVEPASAIDDDSDRQQLIQQSGEMAEEVYAAVDGAPSWNEAPEWAMWLAQDSDGRWFFFENKPCTNEHDEWYDKNPCALAKRGEPHEMWHATLRARPQKDA